MILYVNDSDFTLYVGDVRDVLAGLEDESVHCVVTSPPYWGLRDYGTGVWDGGNPDCDHAAGRGGHLADSIYTTRGGAKQVAEAQTVPFRGDCGKCGATRVDRQLGLEASPDLYVENMVAVFREVRRVLRRDGTCWLNLGDSYAGSGGVPGEGWDGHGGDVGSRASWAKGAGKGIGQKRHHPPGGLKPKDLVGVPWRVAFALQADGWYLRSDVIWSKPNPMPESVTDRPTKAHEYLFLLTKSARYFYDADAIREPNQLADTGWVTSKSRDGALHGDGQHAQDGNGTARVGRIDAGRNRRSVWEIATEPYPDAHFATFPQALVEPCVKAGTSERGCCPSCGAPWERETELDAEYRARLVQRVRPEPLGAWLREKREAAGLRQAEVAALFPSRTGGLTGCVSNWELDKNIPTPDQWSTLKETLRFGDEKDGLLAAWHEYERGLWAGRRDRPTTADPDALIYGAPSGAPATPKGSVTIGWRPSCACTWPETHLWHGQPLEPVPCTVLDIFMGSGTTALVARRLGRRSIGVELNPDYAELAARRLAQLSLLA